MIPVRILTTLPRRLFRNRMRVSLTLSAIAIGIASVITVTAVSTGARNSMVAQIEATGKNLITIDAGKVKEVIGRKRQTARSTTLKERDCDAIAGETRDTIVAAPTQDQTLLVKYGNAATSCRVIGTTSVYLDIRNYRVAAGRFFTDEENSLSARVAVVGTKVIDNLMPPGSPVGEFIRISGVPFEIIGVLAPKGSSFDGANEDEVVFIPLRTGMRRLFNVDYIRNIYVSVRDKDRMAGVEESVRALLRERHRLDLRDREDDFTIQNSYATLTAESAANDTFAIMIFGASGLSLLVGGAGILAVMLLSVRERTSEIGLRIAVGAKSRHILAQFLLEALLLGSLGGFVGVAMGLAATFTLGQLTQLGPQVSVASVIVSIAVSTILGLAFGVYPAQRASRIQPIRALRGL